MNYHWALCEHVPPHRLLTAKDSTTPKECRGLFYQASMQEPQFLDRSVEEWEALLGCVIRISVEPKLVDLIQALDRLNANRKKELFLLYV